MQCRLIQTMCLNITNKMNNKKKQVKNLCHADENMPLLESFLISALTVAGRTTFRSFNMSANIVVSTRVNQLSTD